MAAKEFEAYVGYLDGKEKEIDEGAPITMEIRDLETFERKVVRALVARPDQELPDSDTLWVIDWVESTDRQCWKIKVIQEMDEDTEATKERSDITEADLTKQSQEAALTSGRRYGDGLFTGEGDEEAKKYFIYKTKMEKGKPTK